MTQSVTAATRISEGLAAFIESLSENKNAAMRGLMLLGADELGIDPTLVADDLRVTMAARLPPELYRKLQAMRDRVDDRALVRSPRNAATKRRPRPGVVAAPRTGDRAAQVATVDDLSRVRAAAASVEQASPLVPVEQHEDAERCDDLEAIGPFAHLDELERRWSEEAEEAFDPFNSIGFDFDEREDVEEARE